MPHIPPESLQQIQGLFFYFLHIYPPKWDCKSLSFIQFIKLAFCLFLCSIAKSSPVIWRRMSDIYLCLFPPETTVGRLQQGELRILTYPSLLRSSAFIFFCFLSHLIIGNPNNFCQDDINKFSSHRSHIQTFFIWCFCVVCG